MRPQAPFAGCKNVSHTVKRVMQMPPLGLTHPKPLRHVGSAPDTVDIMLVNWKIALGIRVFAGDSVTWPTLRQ